MVKKNIKKMDRLERIKQIEEILLANNKGWTRAELAKRFGVDRSTVKRDIDRIQEKDLLPLRLEGEKIYLNCSASLSHIPMDMHEMLALHLATRLLVRKSSFASEHFISLLRKISSSFADHSELISRYIGDTADGFEELNRGRVNHRRTENLELLNRAWAEQKKVKIQYKVKDTVKSYTCGIYCFEPYADGVSLYVIAQCDGKERLSHFKLERIQNVKITREGYEIPVDFNPHRYFRDSWGIWVSHEQPVRVRLKFNADAAERIRENRWHVSEEIEELGDGGLVWSAWISEPKEMVPWVRSWGDQVEVLEGINIKVD